MKEIVYTLFCVSIGMIGYTIHGSIFWAIVDFFFAPFALAYWLITHQINLTVISTTFNFLK